MPYGYSDSVLDKVANKALDEISGDIFVLELCDVLTKSVP